MNSRKTNLRLIENITVQVPYTVSISNGILFHVSNFFWENDLSAYVWNY